MGDVAFLQENRPSYILVPEVILYLLPLESKMNVEWLRCWILQPK